MPSMTMRLSLRGTLRGGLADGGNVRVSGTVTPFAAFAAYSMIYAMSAQPATSFHAHGLADRFLLRHTFVTQVADFFTDALR